MTITASSLVRKQGNVLSGIFLVEFGIYASLIFQINATFTGGNLYNRSTLVHRDLENRQD